MSENVGHFSCHVVVMSENVGHGADTSAPAPAPAAPRPSPPRVGIYCHKRVSQYTPQRGSGSDSGSGSGPGAARLRQARAVPNPGQLRWAGPAKSFAASRSPKKVPRRKVCHWRRTLISVNRCVVAAQSCFLSARPRLWGQSMRPWPAMTKCVATAGEDAGGTPKKLCQGGAVNEHESRGWTSTGITSNRAPPKTSSRSIINQSCDSGVCEKNVHPSESIWTFYPPLPPISMLGRPCDRVPWAAKKTSIFAPRILLNAWQH